MHEDWDCDGDEIPPLSGKVSNLLLLIDELYLTDLELSDLSAGIYWRMGKQPEIVIEQDDNATT